MKQCEKCGKEYGWMLSDLQSGFQLAHCVCCNWDGPCVCPAGLEPQPLMPHERYQEKVTAATVPNKKSPEPIGTGDF